MRGEQCQHICRRESCGKRRELLVVERTEKFCNRGRAFNRDNDLAVRCRVPCVDFVGARVCCIQVR
ncbi:hypothetical protein K4H00_25280, partial [Mycobacterium tuberculosis]|nr:hypothetical protein [Mycobacterium tuberculosis]